MIRILLIVLDLACAIVAVAATHALAAARTPHLVSVLSLEWTDLLMPTQHMPSGLLMACVWVISLRFTGAYDLYRISAPSRIVATVVRAGVGVMSLKHTAAIP